MNNQNLTRPSPQGHVVGSYWSRKFNQILEILKPSLFLQHYAVWNSINCQWSGDDGRPRS